MSALDDIEAATAALNALTAQEAAQKAAIDASVAAALAAIGLPRKVVYLDAVAGLDTNPGTSPVLAVRTPQAAVALVSAGQAAIITLCSDVTLIAPLVLGGTTIFQSDTTQFDGSVTGTRRKLTVAPAAFQNVPGNNFGIYTAFAAATVFYGCDLAAGAIPGGDGVINAEGNLSFARDVISLDPGCAVPLIYSGFGIGVFFLNVTLPLNYSGRIFANVPAGSNPNTPLLRTNLLTA